jgi:hypothetical protein
MKQLLSVVCLALASATTACTSMQSPYVAYPNRGHPLNDTAVLIAHDNQGRFETRDVAGAVVTVDGERAGCATSGDWVGPRNCPWWVRVTSGTHAFTIRYRTDFGPGNGPGISVRFREAEIPLTIPDMKARHTYRVRFARSNDRVAVTYDDLGENSTEGIRLCGVYGDCKSTYTPKFE